MLDDIGHDGNVDALCRDICSGVRAAVDLKAETSAGLVHRPARGLDAVYAESAPTRRFEQKAARTKDCEQLAAAAARQESE